MYTQDFIGLADQCDRPKHLVQSCNIVFLTDFGVGVCYYIGWIKSKLGSIHIGDAFILNLMTYK